VIVTSLTIILGLIINSMAGFAFACFDFPLKKVLYAVILMTFMIPFEAIALPLSVPVTISAALMIFISQWNSYLWPLIIGMSKDMQVIQTALGSFQQERGTLWSCLYAATAISSVIPLVIFLPLQKYYVEGITSSGVKG
jgi:ABC-type glycerol-3-phosphate transport system permease component